jgi:hypothetical protein
MIYATYLLPFCLTVTSFIAKILQVCRSLLLLIYPLYITSTPQQFYFPSPTSEQLPHDKSINITPQQIWHQLLRYQIDLHCLQTLSFQTVLSSLSTTHITKSSTLTTLHGDYFPPQIAPQGDVKFSQTTTTLPLKPGLEAQQLQPTPNREQQPPLSTPMPTGSKKREKVKLSNAMFIEQKSALPSMTSSIQNNTNQPLTLAQQYTNYVKASNSLTSLIRNPIYFIPSQKIPQLQLTFRQLHGTNSDSTQKSFCGQSDVKPPQPMAFTGQLQELFSNLITTPFPSTQLPPSLGLNDIAPSPVFVSTISSKTTNYQPQRPTTTLPSFNYLQAQEILLYLFSTDSTPQSPYSTTLLALSQGSNNNNDALQKTFYNPQTNSYINTNATKTSVAYHWYLFTTALVVNGLQNNSMSITNQIPTSDCNQFVDTDCHLYQHLDWIEKPLDLVQVSTTRQTNREMLDQNDIVSTTTAIPPTAPISTTLSILNRIESRLPNRKHKPTIIQHRSSQQQEQWQQSSSTIIKPSDRIATLVGAAAASSSDDDSNVQMTAHHHRQQQPTMSVPTMCESTTSDDDNTTPFLSINSNNTDAQANKAKPLQKNKQFGTTVGLGMSYRLKQRNDVYKDRNPIQSIVEDQLDDQETTSVPVLKSTTVKKDSFQSTVTNNSNINPVKKQKFSLKSLMAATTWDDGGRSGESSTIVIHDDGLVMLDAPATIPSKSTSKIKLLPTTPTVASKQQPFSSFGLKKGTATAIDKSPQRTKSSAPKSSTTTTFAKPAFNPFLGAEANILGEKSKLGKSGTKKDNGCSSIDTIFAKFK